MCGATDAHRYRREIRGQNITTYALSIIKIGVQLEIFQDLNSSFTDIQRMYTGQFIQIKALFHDLIAMPSLDGLNISLKQVTNDGIHLLCPDGSIRAADSFGCSKYQLINMELTSFCQILQIMFLSLLCHMA